LYFILDGNINKVHLHINILLVSITSESFYLRGQIEIRLKSRNEKPYGNLFIYFYFLSFS